MTIMRAGMIMVVSWHISVVIPFEILRITTVVTVEQRYDQKIPPPQNPPA